MKWLFQQQAYLCRKESSIRNKLILLLLVLFLRHIFFLLSRSVYVKLVEDARNSRLDELNRIKNNSDSAESSRSDVNFIRLLSDMKLHNI